MPIYLIWTAGQNQDTKMRHQTTGVWALNLVISTNWSNQQFIDHLAGKVFPKFNPFNKIRLKSKRLESAWRLMIIVKEINHLQKEKLELWSINGNRDIKKCNKGVKIGRNHLTYCHQLIKNSHLLWWYRLKIGSTFRKMRVRVRQIETIQAHRINKLSKGWYKNYNLTNPKLQQRNLFKNIQHF